MPIWDLRGIKRLRDLYDVLWGTPSNGQVLSYDSALQKAKWVAAGAGDMTKDTYDADNDGVVDNAEALGGQNSAHHLDRANHTGTQGAGTITGLASIATSGSASDLSAGSVPRLRLATNAMLRVDGITGFTGGGTALDGLATTSLPDHTVIWFYPTTDDYWYMYQLKPGPVAESSPRIIVPDDDANRFWVQILKGDMGQIISEVEFYGPGSGLTALNASNLSTGTVPDGRFPATLPAASGVNLTALNASNLASGTVPDGRFPATLPAASGANLTALNATQLTSGTVPAARLANINARPGWTSMEAFLVTSANVGYAQYNHGTKPISMFAAKSATGSLQAATLRFPPRRVPFGFAAYKTTGALTLYMLADSNSASNVKITGITLYGSNDQSTWTTLYTDSTARTPATADAPEAISLNRSAFSSTTVFDFLALEVAVQVANSKCIGIIGAEVDAE